MAQCDSVQRASSILLNMRLEKSLRDLLKSSTSAHPHLSSVSSSHIRMLGHSGPRNEDFLETCVTVNPTILLHWWFTFDHRSSPGNHIFPKSSYFCSPTDIGYKRSVQEGHLTTKMDVFYMYLDSKNKTSLMFRLHSITSGENRSHRCSSNIF